MGITKMTKEHIALLLFLKVPIIVLITKIDMAPDNVKEATIRKVKQIVNLPIFNKKAYQFLEDEVKCKNELEHFSQLQDPLDTFIPIISISNKTGQNINILKNWLLSFSTRNHWSKTIDGSIMYVDSKYTVKGIGLVVSGTVRGKPIKVNQKLYLGPINDKFIPFKVRSLHNNMRENVNEIKNNEIGCIAVRFTGKENLTKNQIRKGVIVMDNEDFQKNVCKKFKAKIKKRQIQPAFQFSI